MKSTKGTCPSGHVDQYRVTKGYNRFCIPCVNARSRAYLKSRADKPTYMAWLAMKRRCDNPNAQNYYLYGGRGIAYNKTWSKYENFLKDMGEKPSDDYSLERIDNSSGYSKSNCKWATRMEQASNKRNNRRLEYNGQVKTMSEWSRVTGIEVGTIFARLNVQKWPIDKALSIKPILGRNQYGTHK